MAQVLAASDDSVLFTGFPYLAVRIVGALRHLTLLPADRPLAWLDDLASRQAQFNGLDVALVLSPDLAIFRPARETVAREAPAPRGGMLVTARLQPAEPVTPTREIVRRATRLAAFLRATSARGGYLFGDLRKGGRPATFEERVSLEGRQPGNVPRGLTECHVCGGWAGICLDPSPASRDYVVPVLCRCGNDNRCARCGELLAPYRLNSNFFDAIRREVWHIPGFLALDHRCPDVESWETWSSESAGNAAPADPKRLPLWLQALRRHRVGRRRDCVGAQPARTPEEQAIIDLVARSDGRGWAERHAHLILEQARAVGELPS